MIWGGGCWDLVWGVATIDDDHVVWIYKGLCGCSFFFVGIYIIGVRGELL
jgi:hypothetical protein